MSGVQPPSSWGLSSKYFTMVPILGGYISFLGLRLPPSFHEDLTPFRVVLFSFRRDLTSSRVGLCSFRGDLTSSRVGLCSLSLTWLVFSVSGIKYRFLLHLLFWVELQVSLCLCPGKQVKEKNSCPSLDHKCNFKSSPELTPALYNSRSLYVIFMFVELDFPP